MKKIKDFFSKIPKILLCALVLFLVAPLYLLYSFTWRIRVFGKDEVLSKYLTNREKVLFAHWHGDELVLFPYYAYKNHFVLSSRSWDGSVMSMVLKLYGYRVFRGSSSRGGAEGLLSMIKAIKKENRKNTKWQCSLAVDGPRGPLHKVKPGISQLCLSTGLPILVVRVYADKLWRIPRAWNKAFIPKPLSLVRIYIGDPIYLPVLNASTNKLLKEKRKAKLQEINTSIEEEFNRLSAFS